jgi:hypothetical protein
LAETTVGAGRGGKGGALLQLVATPRAASQSIVRVVRFDEKGRMVEFRSNIKTTPSMAKNQNGVSSG